MVFDNEADALRYCHNTGDTLVRPPQEVPREAQIQ
jgi:hypothetical protein